MKPTFSSFLFGGDWNPEQWPEDTWEQDIEKLEDAHINEATINVFSWALLQPSEDKYDFSMLDKIVALLVKHRFNIVMATGTAALPAWMVRTHPEVIRTDQEGRHRVFGGRHNFCPTSEYFRQASGALAGHLAERYADTPGLVAWHVGNEYGGGGGLCYCEGCARAFRVWLKDKYGTIQALNQAWYANFWSHTIYDWDDVVPPVTYGDGIGENKCVISGLQMDYRRFQEQAQLACFTNERDAIRRHDGSTPITTNLMGTFKDLDYFEWAQQMDLVSWDNYPGMDTPPSFTAMSHDLMRGVGGGRPFMLMEQTPNQQGWFPFCKVKRPGEVRKLSWQAVAHGADTVQFFQMKQSLGGCERTHGAVIDHSGSEESRVFKETAALGAELDRVGARLMGSRVVARVAIMFDWQSYWSLEGCVGPTTGFSYPQEVHRFYRPLYRRNLAVDFIPSTSSVETLKKYDLVLAPALISLLPDVADHLESYVSDGGTFVTGYMAGIHDERDLVVPGGYPGVLRRLTGVWVEEIDALAPDETIPVEGLAAVDGQPAGQIVASLIHCEGAKPLASYGGGDFYAGSPALTVNDFGRGKAYFVGTPLDEAGMEAFMDPIVDSLGLPAVDTPKDVSLSVRQSDDGTRYAIVINSARSPITADLPLLRGGEDLLAGGRVSGPLDLPPYGVALVALA
ncbi:beta-galactosidase [Bifidobacterium sp. W8113]|uniref:beta-galactosidase n=1 Tax=Bifidobacterium TaxID=1678 RepID=UPI0018DDB639|nr:MULTISPECIES: beta-galactosidase [Bifidobacterium]MBI0089849.1 beta-galactosidase [Bifidobacterium choladohabitans]MBI0141982.1 beta-galactosidase [Bifidobacterium choladohabitans]MBI0146999.1 beta-galactosidase [Bifidobacterium sp. W8104]MCT6899440.1 beta-galactosidase [Bifidobacterium sp.]